MRKALARIACVAFLSSPVLAQAATSTATETEVETYSVSGQGSVDLPGKVDAGGYSYTGRVTLNSLGFTAGSVSFQNKLVEFKGREADFLSNSYTGTLFVPTKAGPATVTVTGIQDIRGSTTWKPTYASQASFGPQLSDKVFDLAVGAAALKFLGPAAWNSTSVPALNRSQVSATASATITSVDPLTGVFSFSGDGNVRASPSSTSTTPGGVIPTMGFGFLVFGLGLFFVRRMVPG